MDQETWLFNNCTSLKGKTVAVTGATGDLGREICKGILFSGGKLLLLNRSISRTQALQKELHALYPDSSIRFLQLDLQNMDSVNQVTEALKQNTPDILLHNAGIYKVPPVTCSTGLKNVFQVNFAAPYYMTKRLMPQLEARRARVVVVGSIASNYSGFDPSDPDFSRRDSCQLVYGNSKRFLMYAFARLFENHPEVDFAMGHPGISYTNISDHYPRWLTPIIKPCLKLFFMKPQKACRGILLALCRPVDPGFWSGPRYFSIWGNPAVRKLRGCKKEEQEQIFSAAEQIVRKMK